MFVKVFVPEEIASHLPITALPTPNVCREDHRGVYNINNSNIKECRSIVRDESSVYFNVTAKHV